MFTLKNEYGNLVAYAETEREKEKLEAMGYKVVSATTEKTEGVNLDKMKVSELEAFAESKGIDLSECKNREEKLDKIKNSI